MRWNLENLEIKMLLRVKNWKSKWRVNRLNREFSLSHMILMFEFSYVQMCFSSVEWNIKNRMFF